MVAEDTGEAGDDGLEMGGVSAEAEGKCSEEFVLNDVDLHCFPAVLVALFEFVEDGVDGFVISVEDFGAVGMGYADFCVMQFLPV